MKRMRLAGKILGIVVLVYLVAIGALYAIMSQPPARFAAMVAKMPGPLFMVLPFERLWYHARGGTLRVGDAAPDFDLQTLDKSGRVQLSSFRGRQPVVLIFGSYT
jgi:hypothetical protein